MFFSFAFHPDISLCFICVAIQELILILSIWFLLLMFLFMAFMSWFYLCFSFCFQFFPYFLYFYYIFVHAIIFSFLVLMFYICIYVFDILYVFCCHVFVFYTFVYAFIFHVFYIFIFVSMLFIFFKCLANHSWYFNLFLLSLQYSNSVNYAIVSGFMFFMIYVFYIFIECLFIRQFVCLYLLNLASFSVFFTPDAIISFCYILYISCHKERYVFELSCVSL